MLTSPYGNLNNKNKISYISGGDDYYFESKIRPKIDSVVSVSEVINEWRYESESWGKSLTNSLVREILE